MKQCSSTRISLRALQFGMPPTWVYGYSVIWASDDQADALYSGSMFISAKCAEKIDSESSAKYMELGMPRLGNACVIQKASYNTIEDMKDVNPQKLHQDICRKQNTNWN